MAPEELEDVEDDVGTLYGEGDPERVSGRKVDAASWRGLEASRRNRG